MIEEKSCGIILFTRKEEQIQYVVVQNSNGSYGFPKGHVKPGDSETETAMYKVSEEVGICPDMLPGFRETDEYMLSDRPDTKKQVVYFLGTYSEQTIQYQQEEFLTESEKSSVERIILFVKWNLLHCCLRSIPLAVSFFNSISLRFPHCPREIFDRQRSPER